jgi:hypothetical protein
LDPGNAYSLYGRDVARRRQGDGGGGADIDAARKVKPDIVEEFEKLGVRP